MGNYTTHVYNATDITVDVEFTMYFDYIKEKDKIQRLDPGKTCKVSYSKPDLFNHSDHYVHVAIKHDYKSVTAIFAEPDRSVIVYKDYNGRFRTCQSVYGDVQKPEVSSGIVTSNPSSGAKLAAIYGQSLKSGINKGLEEGIKVLAKRLGPALAAGLATGGSGLIIGVIGCVLFEGLSAKDDTEAMCKMVEKVMKKTLDAKFAQVASGKIDSLQKSLYHNYRIQRLSGPVHMSQVGVEGCTKEQIQERRSRLFELLQKYEQTIIDIDYNFDVNDIEQCWIGLPNYMAIAMIQLALYQEMAWMDQDTPHPEKSGYLTSIRDLAINYSSQISEAWGKVQESRRKQISVLEFKTSDNTSIIHDDGKHPPANLRCLDIYDEHETRSLYESVEMEQLTYSYGNPDAIVESIRKLIKNPLPFDYKERAKQLLDIVHKSVPNEEHSQ